jgi:Bifunctional DNA primase/polymerase, N-terminal
MPNPILQTALRLVQAGLSVIPIGADKRPAIASWKGYQNRLPTPEEWIAWAASRRCGLAVVLGSVSGNGEVIDVDDPSVLGPWYDLVEAMALGLVARLVIVKTPTDGRHLYYRCAVIAGNQRLALNAQREVRMETRGEGGYALLPPSPAWCHPDHKPYELRQGDLANIPTITPDERAILLTCARAFNEYVEPERIWTPRQPTATDGTRLGDIFAANVSWEDIIHPHGWRVVTHRGEVTRWRRPGKKDGHSATTGHCGDHLYVFSSNAYPFEPGRAYSKFAAFTLLHCGGDFSKAATILARQGYVKVHEGQTIARYQRFEGFQGFKGYRVDRGDQGAKGAASYAYC